jgi:hypothetical protein
LLSFTKRLRLIGNIRRGFFRALRSKPENKMELPISCGVREGWRKKSNEDCEKKPVLFERSELSGFRNRA